MLEVLILSLHVMQEEARPFDLKSNWSKTKIQTTVDPLPTQQVQVDGNVVEKKLEMVDSFTYLGSLVDRNERSEAELVRSSDSNCAELHDLAGSQYLALQHLCVYQDSPLLRVCLASLSAGASIPLRP